MTITISPEEFDKLCKALGPVREWREDDIIYRANDFMTGAFVETPDPDKVGTGGWHGPKQVWVEYVKPGTF
jgi:hypothetical protein